MTEKTGKNSAIRKRYMIDPVAFFKALVLAPLVVAALGCWLAFVPVFAVVFGGPVYLFIGTPVLMWWLGRRDVNTEEIMWLGLLVNIAVMAVAFIVMTASGNTAQSGLLFSILALGSVFAPLWAAVFASFYARFRRPFFAQPV